MSYISLYRKYRSQDFDSLVGQTHIVKTLQNAIVLNRIAHAYIFSGPRGTGKTSLARIFAKALNCQDPVQGEPCSKCSVCQSISEGRSMDVIEIDAASNRGIDEIRSLREQVNYMPLEGKYKVYIIDEAHMLTGPAFNALLKTLEEPPAHVLFILATTEVHKIPITILSRCQRLDFHRLGVEEISCHLQKIAELEGVSITGDTLRHIAVVSEGGMRDALSLLDQLISFKGNEISHQDLLDLIGAATNQAVIKLLELLINADSVELFEELEKALSAGVDVVQLNRELLAILRDLMMIKMQIYEAVDATNEHKQLLVEISKRVELESIQEMIDKLIRALNESKWSNNPRIIFELALIEVLNSDISKKTRIFAQKEVNNKTNIEENIDQSVKKTDNPVKKEPPQQYLDRNKTTEDDQPATTAQPKTEKVQDPVNHSEPTAEQIQGDEHNKEQYQEKEPMKKSHSSVFLKDQEKVKEKVQVQDYEHEQEQRKEQELENHPPHSANQVQGGQEQIKKQVQEQVSMEQSLRSGSRREQEQDKKVEQVKEKELMNQSPPEAVPVHGKHEKNYDCEHEYEHNIVKEENEKIDRTSLAGLKQFWPDIQRKILEIRSSIGIIMQEAEVHRVEDDHIIFVFKDNYSFHRDKLVNVDENKNAVIEAIEAITDKKFQLEALLQKELGNKEVFIAAENEEKKKIEMLASSFNGKVL